MSIFSVAWVCVGVCVWVCVCVCVCIYWENVCVNACACGHRSYFVEVLEQSCLASNLNIDHLCWNQFETFFFFKGSLCPLCPILLFHWPSPLILVISPGKKDSQNFWGYGFSLFVFSNLNIEKSLNVAVRFTDIFTVKGCTSHGDDYDDGEFYLEEHIWYVVSVLGVGKELVPRNYAYQPGSFVKKTFSYVNMVHLFDFKVSGCVISFQFFPFHFWRLLLIVCCTACKKCAKQ